MNPSNLICRRPTKELYRDGDATVKVFDESYPASDVLNEAHNLAIVRESGFPAPALREVTKIGGKWAIVLDYIEGVTLASMIAESPARTDELLERLVDVQLEMHTYKADRLRHHTDKMHRKIDLCGLDATARYELHTRLNSMPRHAKLCHGDLTPGNIIITPGGGHFVIDWAHATQGNASADAARTYLRFMLAGDAEHAGKYMRLFCGKGNTARQYVEKWLPIVASSQLVKGKPEERELLMKWADVVEYE